MPRLAVATGATGAIGSATARRLSGVGWTVALVGRDAARVRAAAEGLGPSARGFVADATDSGAVDASVRADRRAHEPALRAHARCRIDVAQAISASKGGVDGLAAAASATYASRAIRVNAVAPGLVRSNLTRRLTDNESSLQASEAMHPLGRIGHPDDVAGLAAFLLTADAESITGQVISVDGGLSGIKLPPAAGNPRRSVSR